MADPICRWRNPYFKTVREFIDNFPKENTTSQKGRQITTDYWGDGFFTTPYQLACQLGLYYEKDETFIVRFKHNPSPDEIFSYLRNWITKYYVPNPYTKKGFDNVESKILYVEFSKLLMASQTELIWKDVKAKVFEEEIGNDDILVNTINSYSDIFEVKGNKLKLRDGVAYNDLNKYIFDYQIPERNDKKYFFNFFNTENLQSGLATTSKLTKAENVIYFGAPGTGKSYKVDKIIKDLETKFYERLTFHPEFDNTSFVGGYKPISIKVKHEDENGEYFENEIQYKFVPQAFTNIYERAWKDDKNQYYLVIEEINRGNCAEIFGDIFQLLDRTSKYTVTPSKELKEYLENDAFDDSNHPGIVDGLRLPSNLSLLATMNTSDQSLFPMDSAFKRRWDWQYVPICYEPIDEFSNPNESFNFEIDIEDGIKYKWINFIKKVNLEHIKINSSLGMDKCIGNYFIKPENGNIITLKPFINKVIFYLWNDVFKDENNKVFEDNTSYEDFFPIETNGKKMIKKLFARIGLLTIGGEYPKIDEVSQSSQAAEDQAQYGNDVQ